MNKPSKKFHTFQIAPNLSILCYKDINKKWGTQMSKTGFLFANIFKKVGQEGITQRDPTQPTPRNYTRPPFHLSPRCTCQPAEGTLRNIILANLSWVQPYLVSLVKTALI